jgi:long-chain fatty acid transport protein
MAAAAWFCLRHFPGGIERPYPDMPIDRQIRYATGVQYKWSDRLSTGAQFVYADYGNAKIDNDLLKGDYKRNDLFFFALNANWKF